MQLDTQIALEFALDEFDGALLVIGRQRRLVAFGDENMFHILDTSHSMDISIMCAVENCKYREHKNALNI